MAYKHEDFIDKLEGQGMPSPIYEREVRDLGSNTVAEIEFMYDQDADFSHYGEFVGKFEDWTVDRREGILYGAFQEKEYRYKTRSEKLAQERAANRARKDGFQLDESSEHAAEVYTDQDGEYFTVTYTGYKIVRDDLYTYYERNSYRYFKPGSNYCPPKDEEEIGYILEDHKRMEYNVRGDWSPVGIVINLYYKGMESGTTRCLALSRMMRKGSKRGSRRCCAALTLRPWSKPSGANCWLTPA
jgi:hypothetical protein